MCFHPFTHYVYMYTYKCASTLFFASKRVRVRRASAEDKY